MHMQLSKKATPSSGFKVVKTFGTLAVFDPPGAKQYRIGVYLMERLPYRTAADIIDSSNKRVTPSILNMGRMSGTCLLLNECYYVRCNHLKGRRFFCS